MRINHETARTSFESSPVARLATADAARRPHLVPVTFALSDDVVVTAVDHKPKSTTKLKRLRNIADNPHVSLLVDHYDDDWSALWWVRADGQATITEAADHPDLVQALATKYAQYREHPPNGALVVIRIEHWNGWSADQEKA